ncbi:FHA domain-containing protein [Moorena producens JHB]|uniref:FHA domain-containing protein n=1 Tax=Moorena producens (strain JHB) TaxID=1454205 RepID=A0A1D9G2J8_MOOP1|nr:FHA domain-containing protein [Moorena producens]AOY81650.1 FHA domain-containing protein [Moorena producens JHB]
MFETRYVAGVIQGQQAYLLTNLVNGKSQTLLQPQGIWTIGRGRQSAIQLPEKRLSRHHAVIQHIHKQGFYLIDLESTNGSFINGKRVKVPHLLKDGQYVRLASISFCFFFCQDTKTVENISLDILAQIEALAVENNLSSDHLTISSSLSLDDISQDTNPSVEPPETDVFASEESELEMEEVDGSTSSELTPAQQLEILDRFLIRKYTQEK